LLFVVCHVRVRAVVVPWSRRVLRPRNMARQRDTTRYATGRIARGRRCAATGNATSSTTSGTTYRRRWVL
jgi:hypothetical protein